MKTGKILFGIPPHSHVALATDDVVAMKQLGYECHTFTYGRNDQWESKIKKVIGTIRNAFILNREINKVNPQYIYLNSRLEPVGSVRDYLTLLILKTIRRRIPKIVIKTHGSDTGIFQNTSFFYRKMVVPFLTKHVDAWILLSNEEKDEVQKYNPEMARKSHVLPNIIVPERCRTTESFVEKYPLPKDKFICLFAGRMTETKGVFDIIRSISFLKNPEAFHFLLIGTGEDFERLKSEAQAYQAKTSIEFPGFIPDSECDQFYSVADVLLFPTYYLEGFSMALFKSVACGLPVITTPVRAAKDYLTEPENTLWVRPQTPQDIAEALEKIYNDEELRNNMKKNNHMLGKKFSLQNVGLLIEAVFKSTR